MYPFRNKPLPTSLQDTVLFGGDDTPTPFVDPNATGEVVESKYDVNMDYVPNKDYTDTRYNRQSTTEAVTNSILRNSGKLLTRTADSIAFLPSAAYSLFDGVKDGSVDSFATGVSAVVDNPASKFLREREKWLDDQLPVYESRQQQTNTDFSSVGFADKLLNGIAYVGSMALGVNAPGAALSRLSKMAGGSKNLSKLFAAAEAEGKGLDYVSSLFTDAKALSDELGRVNGLKKTSTAIKENLTDFYAGAIESAAEASQTKEQTLKNLREDALAKNNGEPLTEVQEKAINEQASQAMAANFGVNLYTTFVANKLVFHKLLNNKWADDMTGYNKVTREGGKYLAEEAAVKTGKYQKLFGTAKKLATGAAAKGAFEEAKQEGQQFASGDFFVNMFSNPDADSVWKVDNILKAGTETIKKLGSKDAVESMIIGGMIGGGFGGYLNRGQDAQKKANTDRLVNQANQFSTSNSIKELARSTKYSDAADGALINGDRVTYETLKAAQVFDLVSSRDEIGKFDDLKSDLEEARTMPLDTFKEKFDIQSKDYDENKRSQLIDYISNIADKTKAAKTRLMTNYGHKLTQLEQENPDITRFLTMIDVLKDDYASRETELYTKLAPHIKLDELREGKVTPEKLEEFQGKIRELEGQAKSILQEPANDPDVLKDRTRRVTEIYQKMADLQNGIANSATDANYKDLLKINDLNDEKQEKKATEPTKYSEYTKDLNDFKEIQKAKENLINYYGKIVNDIDYAKEVQKQINIANNSSLLENIFSLNVNLDQKAKVDKDGKPELNKAGEPKVDHVFTNPPAGQQGSVQDYIKTGDIYQLYRKQVSSDWKNDYDTYAPFEVTATNIDVINNVPVGKITLEGQRGEKITMNANEFKAAIRPVVGKNLEVTAKYPQEADNVRFYKMFKDRAIKYSINGKEVVGMLGFAPSNNNAEDLVIKYFENGKLKLDRFSTAKFGADFRKGYVKILSERETLAFQFNANAKGYMNFLLKGVEIKNKAINTISKRLTDLQGRLKTAELNNNSLEKNAVVRMIDYYTKLIDTRQKEKDIKQAAADRLDQFENIEIEKSDDLGDDFNQAIDKVLEYVQSEKKLLQNKDADGKTPKQISSAQVRKSFSIEIDGENRIIDTIEMELDDLKQKFIDQVKSQVNPEEASSITDANLNPELNFQYIAALKMAEDLNLSNLAVNPTAIQYIERLVDTANERINEQTRLIEDDYLKQVLEGTNLTVDELKSLKVAELDTVAKFITFINRRGFSAKQRKFDRTVSETGYELPTKEQRDGFVTSRPDFVVKTTGNSFATDTMTKKEFYKNIHKLEVGNTKVRVIPEGEYASYGLTPTPGAIHLQVVDAAGTPIRYNNNSLVTTLPLPRLSDTVGVRFREFEEADGTLSPVKKEIVDVLDNAIANTGTNLTPRRFTKSDIEEVSDGSGLARVGRLIVDPKILSNQLKKGDKIRWFDEKEQEGVFDGKTIRDNKNAPVGILGILANPTNWIEVTSEASGDFYTNLDTAATSLKTKYPAEANLIDSAVEQLTDLQNLREKITANQDSIVTIDVIGKSNGIPNLSASPNLTSNKAFPINGKIIIPESGDSYKSGDVSYRVKPGIAYFEDITTRTFFPIVTEHLGNKQIKSKNGKNTGITFVDNIINAGKLVQAALQDKATRYGTPINVSTAQTEANNMMSLFTYTNDNVDKPEAMFKYKIEDQEVVFYIGSTTPLRLANEEALIKEKLAQKIFNIDRKSLEKDSIYLSTYTVNSDGSVNISGSVEDNYQHFVRENFGVSTNIVENNNGALYDNGYLVLSTDVQLSTATNESAETATPETNAPSSPEESATPDEFTEEDIDAMIAARGGIQSMGGSSAPAASTNVADDTDGWGANINPSDVGDVPNVDGWGDAIEPQDFFLTGGTYKGDINNKMTPKKLAYARKKFFTKYGVNFSLVKGLIDNNAFGMVTKAADVLLSDRAPVGTDYHEEFHLVSQHILPTQALKNLYAEWRIQNNNPNASNNEVEEALAEEFRLHAMGYTGFKGKLKSIFDYLLGKIKKLLNLGSLKAELFNDIYRGKYYGASTYKGTKDFKASIENPFPWENRQQVYRGATKKLVSNIVDSYAKNVIAKSANITPEQRKEAINILSTDKDARIDFLNKVAPNGVSIMKYLLDKSLIDYRDTVKDTFNAQLINYVKTTGDKASIDSEFLAFAGKELNLRGIEETDIDENTTGKDIVKAGDNETDFFQEGVTQMRFLAYLQPSLNPNYSINPDALFKIYMDNLVDSVNSQQWEDNLKSLATNKTVMTNYDKSYTDAVRNINDIIGLNSATRTKAQQFMVSSMWGSLSKISTDFKILKVVTPEEDEGSIFQGIEYRWVNASTEASNSSSRKDLVHNIKDNYTRAKSLIVEKKKTAGKGEIVVANEDEVFTALTGIPVAKFKEHNPNKVYPIVNAFARSTSIDNYLKTYKEDIKTITEYLTSVNPEKRFSFFNSAGKLQYGVQNPTSLFYRMRDMSKNSTIMTLNKPVVLNGVQKKLYKDRIDLTANKLTEDDLHIMFFNSFMVKAKTDSKGIMPFIFSGDKSTLAAIEFTPNERMKFGNSLVTTTVNGKPEYSIDHTAIYREYFADELNDLREFITQNGNPTHIGKNGIKPELPFFSFLDKTNPALYKNIIDAVGNLNNDGVISTEDIHAKYADQVVKETQEMFAERGMQIARKFDKSGFNYANVINSTIENATDKTQAYLNWYASAYAIGIQEQTKLVGSLAYYDQAAKRLPAWNGTKRAIRTDKAWVDWYNNTYNSNMNMSSLRSLTVNDVKTQKDIDVYKENNPADGQAYISLDAARFLLSSSGASYNKQLDDLFSTIEALDKKPVLTEQDIRTLDTYVLALNEYINVLKPQYYGMQTIGNLTVPTFYKFSVIPLTKVLTQNTNLDYIRQLMADPNGPHMVMYDSANKVGRNFTKGLDLYDEDGNYIFNKNSKADIFKSMQVSTWEGLGIQVDMPKAHESVTFGTQMRKLITADLQGNYTINGVSYTSEEVRQAISDLVIDKLEISKTQLMNKLGLDDKFNITPGNVEKVKAELTRQAIGRDMPNAIIQSIKGLTSFDFISNKSKFQQLVNSIVSKKVIKQMMNGDAKAMVSSVGFEKKNNNILKDNRLKFYENEDGKRYMEVLLPNNMMVQYEKYLKWDAKSNLYIFKGGIDENIRNVIGFRIPTQSPKSIENIRIKGFFPAGYANAIAVPFEITSKAGSDFDIDKLNLFMPKFKYSIPDSNIMQVLNAMPTAYFTDAKDGRLSYYRELEETAYDDLTPEAIAILKHVKDNVKGEYKYAKDDIDNRIVKYFSDLMSSPEYYENFVDTIDTTDFRDLARKIGNARGLLKSDKDEKNSSNFYNPLYNATARSSVITAKDTLGAAALATTHHAESQKYKLAINSSTTKEGKDSRVVLGGSSTASLGELLSVFQPDIVEDGKIRLDRIYNFENKKISDILSQFVSATADAAKEDYITSANLDLETFGVASLMVRAGIPIDKIFNFISQPGIIEYTNKLRSTKVATLKKTLKDDVRDEYAGGDFTKLSPDIINSLSKLVAPEGTTIDGNQENLIALYQQLEGYGQMLTDLQQITNFDTKSTGSMLEENEININKYNGFIREFSRMFNEGLTDMTDATKSFTARMREEAINANNLNNDLFKLGDYYSGENPLSPELKKAMEAIYDSRSKTTDKTYKAFRLKNFFNTYLLQRIALANDKGFPTIVARTIAQVKDYKGDNSFIKRLRTGDGKLFMHNGASVQTDESNVLSEALTDLYNSKEGHDLARNIILSGLYQFGLVNNPSTIMNVVPTTLLLDSLRLTSTDPLVEAIELVKGKLDGTLQRAVDNALAHTEEHKGENHFGNYVIIPPVKIDRGYGLSNEDFTGCGDD